MGKIYYEDPDTKTLSLKVQCREISPACGSDIEHGSDKGGVTGDLKRWPEKPQPVTNRPLMAAALLVYDIILCLIPLILIAKAGVCVFAYKFDKSATGKFIVLASSISRNLVNFNNQLITIFTIVFILIVSTTVRRYALWKAERGATVAELEQWQASISLTSTLRAIWSLRAFTFTSWGLLMIWSWYYIGSQAAQREYSLQDSAPFKDIDVSFMSSATKSPFADGSFDKFSPVRKTDITSQYHMYSQATENFQLTDGYDIAGNALIPLFDPDFVTFDKHGWVLDVVEFSTPSSSIGNTLYVDNALDIDDRLNNDDDSPYYTDPRNAQIHKWTIERLLGTYRYNTSFFRMDCAPLTLNDQNVAPEGLSPTMVMSMNITSNNENTGEHGGRLINVYNSYNETHAFHTSCEISQVNIEVEVNCAPKGCKIKRLRPQPGATFHSYRTPFDEDNFASDFLNALLLTCGMPIDSDDLTTFEHDNAIFGIIQEMEKAKNGRSLVFDAKGEDLSYDEKVSIYLSNSGLQVTTALSRHINTYDMASRLSKYTTGFNTQLIKDGFIQMNRTDPNFEFANFNGAIYNVRYELCWPWLIVDIISCTVLFVSAICAFWLRMHTLAPDIFGYVSSLTRDNPHLDVSGGSTLSGIDRARRMKNVKVKMGDVGSHDGAGKIGISYIGDGRERAADLAKHKRYA